MCTFRKGELVRCVDGVKNYLVESKEYVVERTYRANGCEYVKLQGIVSGWLVHRFAAAAPVNTKIKSDGGSTSYYDLPAGAKTLYDLIEAKDMNFSRGNVLKAAYRMGHKDGADELYDWRKIKFAAEREIARLEKSQGNG